MALLHHATLTPTKLELVAGWAPAQPWFEGELPLELVASYRFDDPDGEVGVETLLVRAGGGPVLQVPLTYRGSPLTGAESWLIGTTEHSVLGTRWVYDAIGDPVYRATVTTAVLTGGTHVEQWFDEGRERVYRAPSAEVRGSGEATEAPAPDAAGLTVTVIRVPGAQPAPAGERLIGTWTDHPEPEVLVVVA